MSRTLLSLGTFKFSVSTASFDSISQSLNYNWAKQPKLGSAEGLQFTGETNAEISISGVTFPAITGVQNPLEQVRQMAVSGKPHILVDAFGNVHGYYAIIGLSLQSSAFNVHGSHQKQTYEMRLVYYGSNLSI